MTATENNGDDLKVSILATGKDHLARNKFRLTFRPMQPGTATVVGICKKPGRQEETQILEELKILVTPKPSAIFNPDFVPEVSLLGKTPFIVT